MSEEIKVSIREDGAEATKAKIQELYRTAAAYEAKPGMETAAKSARQEAKSLEADLTRLARERSKEEKEITRERAKQAAEEKLQSNRGRRLAGAVANFAESQAGASGFGGITSALGSIGGIKATIATAVVTAIASGLAALGRDRDQREVTDTRIQSRMNEDSRRARRQAGYRGDSAQATGDLDASADEIAGLIQQRAVLEKEARPGRLDPRRWSNAIFGTNLQTWEGQRRLAENEKQQEAALQKNNLAKKNQQTLFDRDGSVELRIMEERARGHRKEAYELERKKKWTDEYNKALRELGPGFEWAAQEKASLKVHEDDVQRSRALIGRAVNSRSGAGDVRAAVRAAQDAMGGGAVVKELASLREQIASQHIDMKNVQATYHLGPKIPGLRTGGLSTGHL